MVVELTAPCFRCRSSNRVIKEPVLKTTKNNKQMVYGVCAQCGTTLTRLVKNGTVL
jgi:hypothetical protein